MSEFRFPRWCSWSLRSCWAIGRLCDWSVECPNRNHWTVFPLKKRLCMLFRNVGHQSTSDAASHLRSTEGSSKNARMGERSGMH